MPIDLLDLRSGRLSGEFHSDEADVTGKFVIHGKRVDGFR
jgi:hypothetical protein